MYPFAVTDVAIVGCTRVTIHICLSPLEGYLSCYQYVLGLSLLVMLVLITFFTVSIVCCWCRFVIISILCCWCRPSGDGNSPSNGAGQISPRVSGGAGWAALRQRTGTFHKSFHLIIRLASTVTCLIAYRQIQSGILFGWPSDSVYRLCQTTFA